MRMRYYDERIMPRMIRVEEQATMGKMPMQPNLNEDGVYSSPHFVVVVDGASSGPAVRGMPGGVVVKDAIINAMPKLMEDASVWQFIDHANTAIHNALAPWPDGVPPPMAAAVVYSHLRNQIWSIGDCAHALNGVWHIPDLFPDEAEMYRVRLEALRAMRARQQADGLDPIAALRLREEESARLMAPYLDACASLVNNPNHPWGRGMLNGMPVPKNFCTVVELPDGAHEICLASDGAVVSPSGQRGPGNVSEMMLSNRLLHEQDPECLDLFPYWRSFKPGSHSLDDCTLVKFTVR